MTATDLYELAEEVIETIEGAGCPMRENGEGEWRGRCPLQGHDDLTLRVDEERERLKLDCYHVTCDWRAVHQALGLTLADLRLNRRQAKDRDPELRNPDLSQVRKVRWAWQQRIPIGKPSLNVGNEGVGKGLVTAYLAAGWSRGTLDGDLHGAPVNVLIVGNEDALADTWTPRLHVAEADFAHIFFQRTGDFDLDFTEPGDIEHLRGWVRRYSIAVVIFDALLDHLGDSGVDEYKPKAVRLALRPLRTLVDMEDIAAVGNMHPRKGRVLSFRDLVANSHQFNAASRSSLLLAKHPDDEQRRVVAWGKGNHAGLVPTLEFRIKPISFVANGQVIDTIRAVDWAESEVTLEDAVGASTGGPGRPRNEGKWIAIARALTDKPQSVTAIAKASGAARTTTHDVLVDYELDGVAAKTDRGWVRGPRWAAEHGDENDENRGDDNSGGRIIVTPVSPYTYRDEPPSDDNSPSLIIVTPERRARAVRRSSEHRAQTSLDGIDSSGSVDPDDERRRRAAEAIRRAQERGA